MQRFPSLSSRTALPLIATLRLTPNGPSRTPVPTTNYPHQKTPLICRDTAVSANRKPILFYQYQQIPSLCKVDMLPCGNSICPLKRTRYICHRQMRYVPLFAERENGSICTLRCKRKKGLNIRQSTVKVVNILFKIHNKQPLKRVAKHLLIVILYKINFICLKLLTNSTRIIYNKGATKRKGCYQCTV